ncbi:MAG: AAA family ATPase [Alphaproteobacteria bacterium]|uniref:AAA family ATPase n=1 Tax=Candidatus Nitrobium versatile TaxID=2884831 RepID=A0A953J377_9BACT|nr:AAA family ATPase [Candidatus Nitrobium versatile]
MKLNKIEITNFRCFENLAISLQPDINVFVGINGAGKSTILDAIAIALWDVVAANGGGGKRQRSSQEVDLRPADIHIPNSAQDALTGRRDFVQISAVASNFYELPSFSATTPQGEARFIEWQDNIQFRPPRDFDYTPSQANRVAEVYDYFAALWQQLRTSDEKALIPLPVVAYYRAHRRLSKMPELGDIFSLNIDRKGAYHGALNAGANFRAMCQWFYLRENQELREKVQHKNDPAFELADLKAARRALTLMLENVERIFFDNNPPSLKVAMNEPSGQSAVLELEQLSDGYRNLLAVVLDFARRLAQANPGWENPLEAPGILLIDEIELHLHPGWQQTVIPNLQKVFPNTQLIIATHSPQVLTTVKREHIHMLASDHTFEQMPHDVGTFGAESSRVLQEIFGVHARPRSIETSEKLKTYLSLVEAQQQDSENGRALRQELEKALGSSDPDLVMADIRISQIEALRTK